MTGHNYAMLSGPVFRGMSFQKDTRQTRELPREDCMAGIVNYSTGRALCMCVNGVKRPYLFVQHGL